MTGLSGGLSQPDARPFEHNCGDIRFTSRGIYGNSRMHVESGHMLPCLHMVQLMVSEHLQADYVQLPRDTQVMISQLGMVIGVV